MPRVCVCVNVFSRPLFLVVRCISLIYSSRRGLERWPTYLFRKPEGNRYLLSLLLSRILMCGGGCAVLSPSACCESSCTSAHTLMNRVFVVVALFSRSSSFRSFFFRHAFSVLRLPSAVLSVSAGSALRLPLALVMRTHFSVPPRRRFNCTAPTLPCWAYSCLFVLLALLLPLPRSVCESVWACRRLWVFSCLSVCL